MSWFTLGWSMLLNGVLNASTAGAIGLNHRKNGVLNVGLIGLMFLGAIISSGLAHFNLMNPYWAVPICILVGAGINVAFNWVYIGLLRRLKSESHVSVLSIGAFGLMYGLAVLISGFLSSNAVLYTLSLSINSDFTLFTVPGVLIIGVAFFLFSFSAFMSLSPVVDSGPRGFDKWDITVYAISGITACVSGALLPIWSGLSWTIFGLSFVGVLVGGVDKKINPTIGGLLTSFLLTWLSNPDLQNVWIVENSILLVLVLGVVSLFLYPRGLVGSFRKIVEYQY